MQNFQFDIFDLTTLDEFELKCDQRKLRIVLIGVPDTIHVDLQFNEFIFSLNSLNTIHVA